MSDRTKIALIRKHKLCAVGPQRKAAKAFVGDGRIVDLDETPIEHFVAGLRGTEWIGIQRIELLIPRGKGITGDRQGALRGIVERLLDAGIKLTEFETDSTCNGIKGTLIMWETAVRRMKNRGNPGAKGAKPKHVYTQDDVDKIKRVADRCDKLADKIAAVQEHYPQFDQNTYYRLRTNGWKPFTFVNLKESDDEY